MSRYRSAATAPGTPLRNSAASLQDAIAGFTFRTRRSSTPTSKDITTLHGHIASPRRNLEMVEFSTPQWINVKGREHEHKAVDFRTPQRITMMGREHEVAEFRTPQHPLTCSNNWGGDSPLLSEHIPKESRLHTNYFRCPDSAAAETSELYLEHPSPAGGGWRRRRQWGFSRLTWRWRRREESTPVHLGGGKAEAAAKESVGYVSHSRWPQGW